jgi:hypothetical protein
MNTLDTRDLEKRRQELQQQRDWYTEYQEDLKAWEAQEPEPEDFDDDGDYNDAMDHWHDEEPAKEDDLDEDEAEELIELDSMAAEISEWGDGVTLIDEDDFEEYTEESARDFGAVGDNSDWIVIDWEKTADNLRADYSSVEYQGSTYLYRG